MVDLHIHSICSDGTDELYELLNNIKVSKINRFALTDHDTVSGCRKIIEDKNLNKILKNNQLEMVVGVEWSCIYGDHKMHILAYDFDPFAVEIFNLEKQMRCMLDEKDEFRIKILEEKGFKLSNSSINYLKTKENVRTMDFAKCLLDDGYFDDIQLAGDFVAQKIKYPKDCRFDAVELIKTMKKLNATIVWAHSIYDVKRKFTSFEDVEKIAKELKNFGLDGLECFYSLYSKEEILRLVEIAHRNDLVVTCGSDYHGKNKKVQIGQFSADNLAIYENEIYNNFKKIIG